VNIFSLSDLFIFITYTYTRQTPGGECPACHDDLKSVITFLGRFPQKAAAAFKAFPHSCVEVYQGFYTK
jgi:hypothetical protein